MDGENIYDKIREIFGESPGTLSILEEKVDIDLQMEYFEVSKKVKKRLDEQAILEEKHQIFNPDWPEDKKKKLFVGLASLDNVEAYRHIEKYLNEGHGTLRNWAILALQESRMLLESKLLDENQVFISTGLGGKGSKLRYFVVLIRRDENDFPELHKKVVRNEFDYVLKKYNSEIENIEFLGNYATLLTVIPLRVPLKEAFREAIQECNQYGDFLRSNFIVTNVRELDRKEIEDFLRKQEQANENKNPR
jgi:hypothetical protein